MKLVHVCVCQDKVQRPRETHYQFTPKDDGCTEELCVKLYLDPEKVHELRRTPVTPGPLTLTSTSNQGTDPVIPRTSGHVPISPQLSGVWAARSHVIRPLPLDTPSSAPPGPVRSYTSPEPVSVVLRGDNATRGAQLSSAGAVPYRREVAVNPVKGAWSKPGSGAAVVKSRTNVPRQRPASLGDSGSNESLSSEYSKARHLKHSISSPVGRRDDVGFRTGFNVKEGQFRGRSHDQYPKSRDHRRGSWHRVSKDRTKGERSRVGVLVEQEGENVGYQRSSSTTQAHQRRGEGEGISAKPYSEPSPRLE